jgi:imidazolonepropionase-like amidohydrolase
VREGDGLTVLTLKAAGLVDVDTGEIIRPGVLRIEGDRIAGVGGPPEGEVIDLGELTLLPGLMDMEVNLLMGGRGETAAYSPVQDDPPLRMLRAVGNARRTLRAGFTTVRNLGLFVKTGGYLLDVALAKAIDAGWIDGPRVVPAGPPLSASARRHRVHRRARPARPYPARARPRRPARQYQGTDPRSRGAPDQRTVRPEAG